MRETCASGTVGGEGGNILAYPARAIQGAADGGFAALNPPYFRPSARSSR